MLRRIVASFSGLALTVALLSQLASAAEPAKINLALTQESTGSASRIEIDGMTENEQIYLPFETLLNMVNVSIPYRLDQKGGYVAYPVGAGVKYSGVIMKDGVLYVDVAQTLGNLGVNATTYVDTDNPSTGDLQIEIW